jgi:hypothetical protein
MKKLFSRERKYIILVFFLPSLLLLTVSAVYAFLVGSAEESGEKLFECAFQSIFPFYCPGCGGSRSLYYLMRLDLVKSFIFYPALPLSALILLDVDIRALVSFIKNDLSAVKKFKLNVLLLIPIVIMLNFIIRNFLLFFGIDYIGDII